MAIKKVFRFVCLVVLCLSLFGLSGCQASSNLNSEVIKLTLWHGINPPPNRDVFNALVDKFNSAHPNIEVEPLYIGQPDAQLPKILTSVVGNVPPDMLWFTPQITGQLAELGAIRPLEDWFNSLPIKGEIEPVMLQTMRLNGHIWSIPMATNNAAVFYRPSLFEKAGITQIPKTWDEFYAVAKKLTKDLDGDRRMDQYGAFLSLGKGEWTVFVWLPLVFSANGELLTADNYPDLVNNGTLKALRFGGDLVREGIATLSSPERGYELDDFIAGRAAMQITGPWTLGYLNTTNIDYGVFPMPRFNKSAAVLGGENLFLFKTTPEREQAALTFFEYVLSENFQTEWALGTGYLPINVKAKNSQKYREFVKENPALEVFLNQMKWARSRPIIPGYARLSENLGRAIEASLLNRDTAKNALEKAQKRMELVIGEK